MSRSLLILILLLVVLIGGAVWLASMDTEVAPVRVEKAMLNEAVAK
jgi:hypothetical protein